MKKGLYLLSCMTAMLLTAAPFAAENITEKATEAVAEAAEKLNSEASYLSQFDSSEYIEIGDYENIPVKSAKGDTSAIQDEIGEYLIHNSSFLHDLPQPFVNRNTATLKDTLQSYADTYNTSLADFMKYYNPDSTEQTYEQEIKDMGLAYSKKLLAMQAVADAEGMDVTGEELEKQIETQAEAAGFDSIADYKKAVKLDPEELREVMMSTRVLNFLQDKAVFEEQTTE
ncbi:MAG: hypothetical protein PHS82_01715 [Lachnospiraceae bacterium]|nr:hypothetical protein [Lachnospiraceae bacterium]